MPFELIMASSSFRYRCRDAGELRICLPASLPASLTESAARLCAGCSRPVEAPKNANYHFVRHDGVEGKCLAGWNRRAALALKACTPSHSSEKHGWREGKRCSCMSR